MKKRMALLMLVVTGLMLWSAGQAMAEDTPDEEIPELSSDHALVCVFDTGAAALDEAPAPDPDEPEPCE